MSSVKVSEIMKNSQAIFARASLAALLSAGPIVLSATPSAASDGSDRVRVQLQGHIPPKCSLSNMAGRLNFDAGGVGQARSGSLGFTIDCNTPFIYRLSAQQGAMQLQGSGEAANTARVRLPYSVSLTIPTDDGRTLNAECGGEMLSGDDRAPVCDADSGHSVAMNKRGQMVVSMSRPAQTAPAGAYTDDLQIILALKE